MCDCGQAADDRPLKMISPTERVLCRAKKEATERPSTLLQLLMFQVCTAAATASNTWAFLPVGYIHESSLVSLTLHELSQTALCPEEVF